MLRLLLPGLLLAAAGCSSSTLGTTGPLHPDLAKKMLPEAAGMSRALFEELAQRQAPPANFDDVNLTIYILTTEGNSRDIRFLGNSLSPAKLASAIAKGDAAYASTIQPEYITKCACETSGDTARGTVGLKADDIYEGQIEFSAKRTNGVWKIVEFRLPNDKITLRRDEHDRWKVAKD